MVKCFLYDYFKNILPLNNDRWSERTRLVFHSTLHRQPGHCWPAHHYLRRTASRNPHQGQCDGHCGRRRLLSHFWSGCVRDQCGECAVFDATTCCHYTAKHTRHQDSTGSPSGSRVTGASHARNFRRRHWRLVS